MKLAKAIHLKPCHGTSIPSKVLALRVGANSLIAGAGVTYSQAIICQYITGLANLNSVCHQSDQ
jgi:hypothetical protein